MPQNYGTTRAEIAIRDLEGFGRPEVQSVKLYAGDHDGTPAVVGGKGRKLLAQGTQIECYAMKSRNLGRTAARQYLQHRRDTFLTNINATPFRQITWDFNLCMLIAYDLGCPRK